MEKTNKPTPRTFQEKASSRHLNLNQVIRDWNFQQPSESNDCESEDCYWNDYLNHTQQNTLKS